MAKGVEIGNFSSSMSDVLLSFWRMSSKNVVNSNSSWELFATEILIGYSFVQFSVSNFADIETELLLFI